MKSCTINLCVNMYVMLTLLIAIGCMSGPGKTPGAVAQPIATVDTVEIRQMAFVPQEIIVNKGNRIVFVNRDPMTHDITEASNQLWHSPPLQSGQSWTFTAERTTHYFCSIHPVMKGSVTVK